MNLVSSSCTTLFLGCMEECLELEKEDMEVLKMLEKEVARGEKKISSILNPV